MVTSNNKKPENPLKKFQQKIKTFSDFLHFAHVK